MNFPGSRSLVGAVLGATPLVAMPLVTVSLVTMTLVAMTACCRVPADDGSSRGTSSSPAGTNDTSPGHGAATIDALCPQVCKHRSSCGLPTSDTCAEECTTIRHLFVGDKLSVYTKAECSRLQQDEPYYANAVRCSKGCDRRVACLHVGDREACVSDCSMAGLRPDHLDEYAKLSCSDIESREPDHQELRQMIRTCKRLIECAVPGEMTTCLQLAKKNLASGVYKVDKLASLEKESCDVLKKTTYINPPRTAGGGGGGGGSYVPQGSNGWFGSWVDTRGKVVTSRPPPPGSF